MKRLVFGLVLTAFALPVMAVPFSYLDSNNLVASYDGSENVYQYVLSPLNFFDALAASETYSWNGVSGHLVTITSLVENDFLYDAFVGPRYLSSSTTLDREQATPWIALSDSAVDGEWRWVAGPENGEIATFQHWNYGEPNNYGGAEDYAVLHWQDRGKGTGWWYDYGPYGYYGQTFIVEFENALTPPPAVPEPTTLALMALGVAGLRYSRRKH